MKTIAIVGGGAAGALVAVNLLKRLGTGDRVVLIEASPNIGRGVPYGTFDSGHLLNVRASNMSAFPSDPSHFVRWLATKLSKPETEVAPTFASRTDYGQYVGETVSEACAESKATFSIVKDRAKAISHDGGLVVDTEHSGRIDADHVVLATGHISPSTPEALLPLLGDPRYLPNPWRVEAIDLIGLDDAVLLVGTGLTMVDLVSTLHSRGHRGKIYARSRRGLIPAAHRAGVALPLEPGVVDSAHIRRSVSSYIRSAGDDWRAAMDGLRSHTEELWNGLSWTQRGGFVNRLRPYWDVHRHRMPEQSAELIASLQASTQLSVKKGRIGSVSSVDDWLLVKIQDEREEQLRVQWIVNCTGPELDLKAAKIGIIESAVQAGLASYDPLGIGLMVDAEGRTHEPRDYQVWALGPLCRGCRWETTAIPEIRQQADRIARGVSG